MNNMYNATDTKYVSKEDFNEFVDIKLKRNMNSIINTINSNYNSIVDWQRKSLIIGFIISLIIAISLATSIIVNFISIDKLNKSMEALIEINEQQTIKIEELQSQIIDLQIDNEILEIEDTVNQIEEEILEIEEEIPPITYNTNNIAHKSGYTAEQFDAIINKVFTGMNKEITSMTTIGDSLYTIEQEYDVNGLYLLGIASLESGWGTSGLATKSNNIYGLIGRKFDSVDKCTEYMGSWIRSEYIDKGYDTLDKIQTKYCPNGGSKWINDVTWCMNRYINAANELYSQQ